MKVACNVKSGPNGFDHITVNFSVEDDYPLSTHWFSLQVGEETEVRQLFEKLIYEWYKRRPYYREKCQGYLYEIIAFLLAAKQELQWEQLQKIEPARVYLEEHFKENVPLHELAGLSDICLVSEVAKKCFNNVHCRRQHAITVRFFIRRTSPLRKA